jgi:hypothetical protein
MPHDTRIGRKTPVAPQSSLRVAFRVGFELSSEQVIKSGSQRATEPREAIFPRLRAQWQYTIEILLVITGQALFLSCNFGSTGIARQHTAIRRRALRVGHRGAFTLLGKLGQVGMSPHSTPLC